MTEYTKHTASRTAETRHTPSADGHTLVLCGNGKNGRRVAARLTALGHSVRVGSRAGAPAFDWEAPATWGPALSGVRAVLVVCQPDVGAPGTAEAVREFAGLAARSGVRRLVLLSARGEDLALDTERAVRETGTEWTVLRASWFAQNFSEGVFLPYVLGGELPFPAGEVPEPFIDADDLADVAVAALTEDGHHGQVYDLTGPRALTYGEACAEIARESGHEVRYRPVTGEWFAQELTAQGLPPELVAFLGDLFAQLLDGRNAQVSDGVQRVLGRPARDFTDVVREAAGAGAWSREAEPQENTEAPEHAENAENAENAAGKDVRRRRVGPDMSERDTLVMASSGKTGRRVARRLRELGVPVRAASRAGEGRERFEWGDRSTWGPALEGVRAVYVVPLEATSAEASEAVEALARQAVESGVERLVLLSAYGYPEATEAVEGPVRASGAAWTVLRPSWFDQNFSEDFLRDPVLSGEVQLPTGEGRVPFIDAEDIADVAVAALTGDGHDGQTYGLTGPRLMSFGDAVAEIAAATGCTVRYVPVSDGEYMALLREAGLDEEAAAEVLGLLTPLRDDSGASQADGVQRALGRPPRDFADYAEESAAEGAWHA